MELTLILGDRLLPKRAAVEAALEAARLDRRDVQVFLLDNECGVVDVLPHANPDYAVRTAEQRRVWKHALKKIRASVCHYCVVVCSAFAETASGPELILPLDILRTILNTVDASGGTTEVVCLIDDVFASAQGKCLDIPRALSTRQLEWTFAQYLASQFRGTVCPRVSCYSLHHPITNLSRTILRTAVASAYLCYPINFFRRDPAHPLKAELENFRTNLAASGLIVLRPSGD